MIAELGNFALIIALAFALLQSTIPLFNLKSNSTHLNQMTQTVAIGQFSFLLFAILSLMLCFIKNDFSLIYVREHSNFLLPLLYRIGATWGGHEGSLLLWCLILSGWTVLFLIFSNSQLSKFSEEKIFITIIMILGIISTGFIAFLFFTSNPFWQDFPTIPVNGEDLTPVLQDPGLIFHPPMLYLGYVGFAIGFAFAMAALIHGKLEKSTLHALKPWIILPWSFLSCGIVLGSWWAYRELGWGGWWFWDPVENASLLPWLSATALIHSLLVSEKKGVFKGWTLLLAIVTFSLSLIGTFLVRSGVLVSVHAFANDPLRGVFLLGFLALLIGGALFTYSIRIHHFYKSPQFSLFSKETFLLINTIILLTAVATILLGTIYPIILDSLNIEKISVGEPYFNTVFIPIILPLLILMGLAPHMHWHEDKFFRIVKKFGFTLIASILFGFSLPPLFGFTFKILTAIGITFGIWIIIATLHFVLQLWQKNQLQLKHFSMVVAHIGLAVIVLGITINKSYSDERQVKMTINDSVSLSGYQFNFSNLSSLQAPDYNSMVATFIITKQEKTISDITTEARIYKNQDTFNKSGIDANIFRDLYVVLGSPIDNNAWSIRIYYEPFVRWIWAGGFILMFGGFLSLLNFILTGRKPDEIS